MANAQGEDRRTDHYVNLHSAPQFWRHATILHIFLALLQILPFLRKLTPCCLKCHVDVPCNFR